MGVSASILVSGGLKYMTATLTAPTLNERLAEAHLGKKLNIGGRFVPPQNDAHGLCWQGVKDIADSLKDTPGVRTEVRRPNPQSVVISVQNTNNYREIILEATLTKMGYAAVVYQCKGSSREPVNGLTCADSKGLRGQFRRLKESLCEYIMG